MNNHKSKESSLPEYNSNPFTLTFKGFGLLAEYAKNILIIMIVIGSLGMIINLFSSLPSNSSNSDAGPVVQSEAINSASEPTNTVAIVMIILGIMGILVFALAITLLISAAYKGFVAAGTVSSMDKRSISVSEAFSNMKSKFIILFKAEIITTLKIIGGYILFIVPGVRAQLRYQSTPFIIMSRKNISANEAIATSKDLYKNHLMEAFGIATVGSIIPFIGQALMASGMTLSVNQLTAYKKLNKETPKTHWLNYTGIVLAIFFIMGILFFILLIAAFSK